MALEMLLTEMVAEPTQVFVSIVGTQEMQRLNTSFRNVNSVTDVLSFESGVSGDVLGDIAICLEQAQLQAKTRGDTLSNELALLAIHGGLHLLGFDDVTPAQRKKMYFEMYRIAEQAGLNIKKNWHTFEGGVN